MHDLAKLFLADRFSIKVNFNVHETTIEVLGELVKNKKIVEMLNVGYNEFIRLLNDLARAKKQRTNAQYYTGSKFMKGRFEKEAKSFLHETVYPFVNKLAEEKNAAQPNK